MSHVLGIPLLKGNSQVIIACALHSTSTSVVAVSEGVFVAKAGGTIEPIVVNLALGKSFGIAMDINECSGKLSVVREAELILVRTDGTVPAIGEKIKLNDIGLVSTTGTHSADGEIVSAKMTGINGKTGLEVADCVLVTLRSLNDVNTTIFKVNDPIEKSPNTKTARK